MDLVATFMYLNNLKMWNVFSNPFFSFNVCYSITCLVSVLIIIELYIKKSLLQLNQLHLLHPSIASVVPVS